jgi:hypothetical protein
MNYLKKIKGKKGMEDILITAVSVIIFILALIICIMIFKNAASAASESLKTDVALTDAQLHLLQFLKTDINNKQAALIIADMRTNEDRAKLHDTIKQYFDARLGDWWSITITYPDSRSSVSVGHDYVPQVAGTAISVLFKCFVQNIFQSVCATPVAISGVTNAEQDIPTIDGKIIHVKLSTWVVFG